MIKGICVATCTVFDKSTEAINEAAYLKHIDRFLEAGVHAIAVNGGTGEYAHMDVAEHRRVAEITAKHIEGKAQLVVQASAIRTKNSVEAAKHAEGLGAAGILLLPALFEGAEEEGVFRHYETVANAVKTPIVVYNIPASSGFDITPEFYKRLSAIPTIEYIKDSTGSLMRVEELIAQGAKVLNGCDFFALSALMAGAEGCFWGGANIMPKQCVELYDLVMAGKLVEANTLWKKMKPAQMFIWNNHYNSSVKAACRLMGNDIGDCRLPVVPLKQDKVAELKVALAPLLG